MAWYGIIWHGIVLLCMWHGKVRHGMAWYFYSAAPYITTLFPHSGQHVLFKEGLCGLDFLCGEDGDEDDGDGNNSGNKIINANSPRERCVCLTHPLRGMLVLPQLYTLTLWTQGETVSGPQLKSLYK